MFATPDLLKINEPYRTINQWRRLRKIESLRQLFAGKHKAFFFLSKRTQHAFARLYGTKADVFYMSENLPGLCVLKHADLLLGEPVIVEPGDFDESVSQAIERINSNSKINQQLYKLITTAGWAGKSYAQITVANGSVKISEIKPELIEPTYDDADNLIAATYKKFVKVNGKDLLKIVRHEVGKIITQYYQVEAGKIIKRISVPGCNEIIDTKINHLTIIETQNFVPAGEGMSDFAGSISLIDEINSRLTKISEILDQHGAPAIVALRDLFDEDGNLNLKNKVIAADNMEAAAPIKYVTWQAQLVEQTAEYDRAVKAFLRQMEVAPCLIGIDGGTSADGWKKYRLQLTPTLARVNRKQQFFAPTIVQMYQVAMELENAHLLQPSYQVSPVKLSFADGIPADADEVLTRVTSAHASGLMSRKRALLELHGNTRIADAELEQLDLEQEQQLGKNIFDNTIDLPGAQNV